VGDILYRRYIFDGVECIGFRHLHAPLGLYYKDVRTDDYEKRAFARHIIKEEGVDIVHATYPQPFASFLMECKEIGTPYIVTCTDFAMLCHYSTLVSDSGDFCVGDRGCAICAKNCPTYGCSDFGKRYESARTVLEGASFVTVPSEFVARLLGDRFPTVAFRPVNHGISEAFRRTERAGRVKKFVYAGTISPLKGIHLLLDAFSRLEGDGLSLRIYGSGDGRYESELKKQADPRVEFCGVAAGEDMPGIYADADCVVIPSMWYETYNFVRREAANTGALVLAADIGAMSEAVRDGENGYLFKPADADSLYR
jgi:glycosyltransferase involved in cell wall biosynthesis